MVSKSLEQHVGSCFVSKAAQKSPKEIMLNVHFPYNRFKKKNMHVKSLSSQWYMVTNSSFSVTHYIYILLIEMKITYIIEFKIRI